MGAWIETLYDNAAAALINVAPYMGAWIETLVLLKPSND